MIAVHYIFESGIACLSHDCRELTLVTLGEWRSLVVLTVDTGEDKEHCQPGTPQSAYSTTGI